MPKPPRPPDSWPSARPSRPADAAAKPAAKPAARSDRPDTRPDTRPEPRAPRASAPSDSKIYTKPRSPAAPAEPPPPHATPYTKPRPAAAPSAAAVSPKRAAAPTKPAFFDDTDDNGEGDPLNQTHEGAPDTADKNPTTKVYGVAACRALWKVRPGDIVRVYLTEPMVPVFTDLLKALAMRRRPYHVVSDDDLRRITDTVHHGGVCLLTKPKPPTTLAHLLADLRPKSAACIVFLDGVENPHNVGAIMRTCAHFGAAAVLVDAQDMRDLPASAARVAVGGAESVAFVPVEDLSDAFKKLRAEGFEIITADTRGGQDLFQASLPKRAVLLLGAESEGVSDTLRAESTTRLSIPGTGNVESLNVSCAAALTLAEFWRQHPAPPPPKPHPRPRLPPTP